MNPAGARWLLEREEPLLKVTIVPHGIKTLGSIQYLPTEDVLLTKEQLFNFRICILEERFG